jgi:hypothetical protein
LIHFSDADKNIWSNEAVRCRSDDETGLTGKWDSASNSDDVFGPGTGNHGWYTWRSGAAALLFLNRPGANVKGLEMSLIRFFNVRGIAYSAGDGLAYVPSPPDKNGKPFKVVWELSIVTPLGG